MKLSVITDELSMDLAYALDAMSEYGAKGAELRGLWGKNICDLEKPELQKAKEILDDKGFTVVGIATPLLKCELQEGATGEIGRMHDAVVRTFDEQMDLLDHCIELAEFFNTDIIRVFSFWKRGELTPKIEEAVVKALIDLGDVAVKTGKIIGLENEHDCYVGTGVEMGRVLSKVNHPAVKAVWDPGNAFYADESPYPAGYEAIKDHLAHVHIKDAERLDDGTRRFTVVGEGQVNYQGHIAALAKDGYKGYISLETHYVPFAGTQEQGSRLCLAALKHLVDEALKGNLEV